MNHKIIEKADGYVTTALAVLFLIVVVGGALFMTSRRSFNNPNQNGVDMEVIDGNSNGGSNVSVVGDMQIVTIRAKGGYQPRVSVAKAGLPTTLRFDTQGTFDCSAVVRVPSLGISRNLPFSGQTDIPLGTQIAGILKGSCGMGMYPFEVRFE